MTKEEYLKRTEKTMIDESQLSREITTTRKKMRKAEEEWIALKSNDLNEGIAANNSRLAFEKLKTSGASRPEQCKSKVRMVNSLLRSLTFWNAGRNTVEISTTTSSP